MYGKRQPRGGLAVRIAGVGVLLAVAFLTLVGVAGAQTQTTVCVPEASSKPVLSTNTQGECPAQIEKKTEVKYKTVQLPGTGDLETLDKLLPHLKYEEKGVGGKPTIQVTGANLQILSGSGKTNGPVNGAGNLIIGYDDEAECPAEREFCFGLPPQTGSHNLVLGNSQGYTSWGAILGGIANTSGAPGTFVVGAENVVSGIYSSVSGGTTSAASSELASISGGEDNTASGIASSVTGGSENDSTGAADSVSGGHENTAIGLETSVVGGQHNEASGSNAAILGGSKNTAAGERSSISGGFTNTTDALAEDTTILGGLANTAGENLSSVSGGQGNTASGRVSSILGGKGISVECEFCHSP